MNLHSQLIPLLWKPMLQFNPRTVTLWLTLIVSLVLAWAVRKFFLTRGKTLQSRDVLLIVGCPNSGKTRMFYRLQGHRFDHIVTVSSLIPNIFRFTAASLCQDSPLYDLMSCRLSSPLQLVDLPGHPRLQQDLEVWLPKARCILFLIDSSDSATLKYSAERLYALFNSDILLQNRTPILVVCNKSDLLSSKTKLGLQFCLFREINQMRLTQAAESQEPDVLMDSVFRQQQPFSMQDVQLPLKFCSTSVTTNRIDDMIQCLSELL